MPRNNRVDVGGEIYHVINRANARMQIFDTEKDYQLFEQVLTEAKERTDIKIYSYCIMPNHWHLVLSPIEDGDLSRFMSWMTMTHTQRWHVMHRSIGSGHLYQGRYKSFIVERDQYFLQLCRYVERNSVRAKLVRNALNWKWSSLWRREKGSIQQQKLLSRWPADIPDKYMEWVNEPEEKEELESLRYSVNKSKPYGTINWVDKMVDIFKLKSTLNGPCRPKNGS